MKTEFILSNTGASSTQSLFAKWNIVYERNIKEVSVYLAASSKTHLKSLSTYSHGIMCTLTTSL